MFLTSHLLYQSVSHPKLKIDIFLALLKTCIVKLGRQVRKSGSVEKLVLGCFRCWWKGLAGQEIQLRFKGQGKWAQKEGRGHSSLGDAALRDQRVF